MLLSLFVSLLFIVWLFIHDFGFFFQNGLYHDWICKEKKEFFFSVFSCWRNTFTISNQSQHCSEESFSTLLQREEAFMWSENTRLIFFFSSYETLLFKQPEWIVSVHFFKSHHIHLGMDVLGCWKSGPLVHRATKSPDQQFQNVPFSYIASMHTS